MKKRGECYAQWEGAVRSVLQVSTLIRARIKAGSVYFREARMLTRIGWFHKWQRKSGIKFIQKRAGKEKINSGKVAQSEKTQSVITA